MPQSPSAPQPLPPPDTPMTPAERAAYSRLMGCIRAAKYADARAAEKAAAVEQARAAFNRVRAGQAA